MRNLRRSMAVLLLLCTEVQPADARGIPRWLVEFPGGVAGEVVVAGTFRALGAKAPVTFPIGTAFGATVGIVLAGHLCGDGDRGSAAGALVGAAIGQALAYAAGLGIVLGTGTSEEGVVIAEAVSLFAGPLVGTIEYHRHIRNAEMTRSSQYEGTEHGQVGFLQNPAAASIRILSARSLEGLATASSHISSL